MGLLRATWFRATVAILFVAIAGAIGLVAALPVGPLKSIAEQRLSARFGRPVTIGAIGRREAFSFTPTIVVRDIRVPQAAWAGRGDLARIAEVTTRVRALALLRGTFSPSVIVVRGARLDFVRAADGRTNWAKADDRDTAGGDAPRLDGLTLVDTIVRYRDAKRDRSATLSIAADTARGIRATGTGTVRGSPVRITAAGAGFAAASGPWPFAARIAGPSLTMTARGRMDVPLNADRMTLRVAARAADLRDVDAIIEAGLFATQPVALTADVRHDDPEWTITNLTGTIGSSDIAGEVSVAKRDGRNRLRGTIRARRLDVADFNDDAGLRAARALAARIGPRIVPAVRINIAKIARTDGTLAVRVGRMLSGGRPLPIQAAAGTITMDRQLMTVAPLAIGLRRGTLAGRIVVDQRGGRRMPVMTLALTMTGSSIAALTGVETIGGGAVSGRVDGRFRLTGAGDTIRDAIGRSSGTIGLVARDGILPKRLAAMMGFDAGGALTARKTSDAGLRCAVAALSMRNGTGRFGTLLIDTSASQARGAGTLAFPDETIAATMTGAPKHASLIRLSGSAGLGGTLSEPRIVVPRNVKSLGNVLKGLGRGLVGDQAPTATDADCAALSRAAIGR